MNQNRDGIPCGDKDDHPVVGVSWEDAQAFCAWLSKKEGRTYRLPTDEEWSFAVGIGRKERRTKDTTPEMLHGKETTEFPWGGNFPPKTKDKAGNYADSAFHEKVPKAAWLDGYSDGFATTAPVMSFKPNKLGLYDMGGNVWEYVEDWFDKEQQQRTVRGVSWLDAGMGLLSSHRGHLLPDARMSNHGFRIVVENRLPATVASVPAKPALPAAPWQPFFTAEEWKQTTPGKREFVDGRVHLRSHVMKPAPSADGAIRARIVCQQGSQFVGFLARLTPEGGSYRADLNPDGRVVELSYSRAGSDKQVLGQYFLPKTPKPGDTNVLELRLQGDLLTVLVDGVMAIEARDSRCPGSGQWGIRAGDGWFESVEVQSALTTGASSAAP